MRYLTLAAFLLSLALVTGCSDKKQIAPDSSNFKAIDTASNKTLESPKVQIPPNK